MRDMKSRASWLTLLARLDALVTETRVRRWTTITIVCQLLLFVFIALGTHGLIVRLDRPATTDFISFFAAGRQADGSSPALVYQPAQHFLVEQAIAEPGIPYVHFFYPPTYLLICGLLAHLPYLAAFIVFETIAVLMCAWAFGRIAGLRKRDCWLVLFSFSPLLWSVGLGQNACLTAGLFGFGTWLLSRRRPVAAGLVLSCLIFKPHTGLLIPIALAASRSWRGFAAAAAGVCALASLSAWFFGTDIWPSFLAAITHAQGQFAAGHIVPPTTLASAFGAARMLGFPQSFAYAFEAMVSLLVVACVFWSFRLGDDRAEAQAVLVAGTLMIMPVVLFYDTTLLLIGAAWLTRGIRSDGALPGETIGLAVVWLLGLLCYPITRVIHLPLAFAMAVILFGLAVRRAGTRRPRLPSGNPRVSAFLRARGTLSSSGLNPACRCPAIVPGLGHTAKDQ